MNCTVRFGKQFSESSPCLPGQQGTGQQGWDASGTLRKQFTKPTVQFILGRSILIIMFEMEPTEVKFLVFQSLLSLQALPPVVVMVDHVGRLAAPRHGEVAELRDELRVHRPLRFDALALLDGRFALGLRCQKK